MSAKHANIKREKDPSNSVPNNSSMDTSTMRTWLTRSRRKKPSKWSRERQNSHSSRITLIKTKGSNESHPRVNRPKLNDWTAVHRLMQMILSDSNRRHLQRWSLVKIKYLMSMRLMISVNSTTRSMKTWIGKQMPFKTRDLINNDQSLLTRKSRV